MFGKLILFISIISMYLLYMIMGLSMDAISLDVYYYMNWWVKYGVFINSVDFFSYKE